MFKLINGLTKNTSSSHSLPNHDNAQNLCNDFNSFFTNKIKTIRTSLDEEQNIDNNAGPEETTFEGQCLDIFEPASVQEVAKLIETSPSKSCALDTIPTWLIKACSKELAPAIASIINASLKSHDFPELFKTAHIKPLLKKPTLDKEIMKNYRPVSNLNYISKLVEKVVAKRLQSHLEKNDLNTAFQSAYRQKHSTETALLRVHNDVIGFLDNKQCAILVLLDLSAAFDTIDQDILITRLRNRFGVSGDVLKWFESYVFHRSQHVNIDGTLSESASLIYGVPQGSVLGPILYTLYTDPISEIISSYGLNYHLYADDTQLYIPINSSTKDTSIKTIEQCANDIKSWMSSNKLKLNDDKTEVILFKPPRAGSINIDKITIGTTKITNSNVVRNLGVKLDSALSMESQVNGVCQSANFQLRNIGKIRHLIDNDTCKLLVNSLVTSRLDYCNSLLNGVNNYTIDLLQKVQNKAARIITKTKKFEHITPVLKNLHWLPVKERIEYKTLLITYKAIHGLAPHYISNLIEVYKPSKHLRSSSTILLKPSRSKSKFSEKAFSVCAPKLWNALSERTRLAGSLDTFKSHLKTELFRRKFVL